VAHAVQYVVPGGAGDQTGGSWANARADVQAAVDAAALPGEEVWVAAGRYAVSAPVALRSGSVVLGGFAGTEGAVSLRDWDANVTVLDGQSATQIVRMVDIASARLDGFSVAHGRAAATNKMGGAGILINRGESCTVAHCRILHNVLTLVKGATACEGGGVLLKDSLNCTVTKCLFTGNEATYGASLSILYAPGTVIDACRFAGNWYASGQGLVRVNGDGVKYQNCVFSGNYMRYGSFIYSAQAQTAVNCTVCFTGNATDSGAIHAFSPLTIRNNILAFNHPEAVWEMNANADPSVENNLFYGQTMADYFDFDGTNYLAGADAVNTHTVPDNSSGNVDGDPRFVRCPAQDDGIWTAVPAYDQNRTQTTLVNTSTAFRPGALKGLFLNPDTAETLYRHAEIAGNTATSITVWGKADWAAAGTGYRIYDYRLQRDSPAMDAGLATDAPAADIDGYLRRPTVNNIDMGAYEFPKRQGTVMLLSTPLPEPVWRVGVTTEANGKVLTVSSATLAVTLTEGVYWTIRTLYAGETLLVGEFGANGAVANVMTSAYPETEGWMGTGHGFETISSYTVALDGTNLYPLADGNYPARTVTLTKASAIGPLDQVAVMDFPETGDRFVESTRFTANRTLTNSLNFVYAFMHCNRNALTDWRAWLTTTNVLDGACTLDDGSFSLQKDIRAVALFGPALGKGVVYAYPSIYRGSVIRNAFWDRVNDNKLYFRPDIPGATNAAGNAYAFEVTLIPFSADPVGWKDKAGQILQPLFGQE
ncbi:MAG: right-handed parallel beta-helix repeat-containing protein, partial [Kiritimatiellae bacterium]|nr:right-handed parallel beta-helix repeat-containing protein [Kiritimatiellia bacterium]